MSLSEESFLERTRVPEHVARYLPYEAKLGRLDAARHSPLQNLQQLICSGGKRKRKPSGMCVMKRPGAPPPADRGALARLPVGHVAGAPISRSHCVEESPLLSLHSDVTPLWFHPYKCQG